MDNLQLERGLDDARVLIVDDEPAIATALRRILEKEGIGDVTIETDPRRALRRCDAVDYDAVLLDLWMPDLDGFSVMEALVAKADLEGFAPILVLTGDHSTEVRRQALESGARDFLQKPFDPTEVVARVRNLIQAHRMHRRMQSFNRLLAARVAERTEELRAAKVEVLERLAIAGEYRDDDTGQHARRVGRLSELLAAEMGLGESVARNIGLAALTHDIGKIGISDNLLLRQGKLSSAEMDQMRQHTVIGSRILSGGTSQLLQTAERIAISHHEFWNGAGYPFGLEGEDIPVEGRIVAVADAFDAMTNDRSYRKACSHGLALAEVARWRGRQFDPDVVAALRELHDRGVLADEFGSQDGQGDRATGTPGPQPTSAEDRDSTWAGPQVGRTSGRGHEDRLAVGSVAAAR